MTNIQQTESWEIGFWECERYNIFMRQRPDVWPKFWDDVIDYLQHKRNTFWTLPLPNVKYNYMCPGCGCHFSSNHDLLYYCNGVRVLTEKTNAIICSSCANMVIDLIESGDDVDILLAVPGSLFSLHLGGHA